MFDNPESVWASDFFIKTMSFRIYFGISRTTKRNFEQKLLFKIGFHCQGDAETSSARRFLFVKSRKSIEDDNLFP